MFRRTTYLDKTGGDFFPTETRSYKYIFHTYMLLIMHIPLYICLYVVSSLTLECIPHEGENCFLFSRHYEEIDLLNEYKQQVIETM